MRIERKLNYFTPAPLAFFNGTWDDISVGLSAIDKDIFPSPALKTKNPPDPSKVIPISDFVMSGHLAFPEIVQLIYDKMNEKYGTDYKLPVEE